MFASTKEMLLQAQEEGYAIPAFNVYNLETMQAVVEQAAELNSPVIIATTPGTVKYAQADYLVSIAQTAAKKYNIPLCLHLDHAEDPSLIKKCIDAGYKSVMIDASQSSFAENLETTKEVVKYADKYAVSVEAELGQIGGREDNITVEGDDLLLTDPNLAQEFAAESGIDFLAVAIGTAHGTYDQEPELDFVRLEEIEEKVALPLVLHGASGVPEDSVARAIGLGICKVNIATELKIPFTQAVKDYLQQHPETRDLRKYLTPGKEAMQEVVATKIKLCRSTGRAR